MHRETIIIIDTSQEASRIVGIDHTKCRILMPWDIERGETCVQVVVGDFEQVYQSESKSARRKNDRELHESELQKVKYMRR